MRAMDAKGWIGAALPRREDRRHLLGQGVFAADIAAHDALHVAFLRSDVAHGRIVALHRPAGAAVYAAGELGRIGLLPAGPDMPAFRQAPYPPLADGVVRFVGQPIAACLAATRAEAEDLLAACHAEVTPLPALADVAAALAPGAAPLHPGWADNRYATGRVRGGDVASLGAPLRIHRRVSLGRQSASPIEPRAMLAVPDRRTGELVLHVSSQGPHTLRHALASMLGIPEARLRVVAPDVGGGFGAKNRLMPEEVVVCALALALDRPIRWVETRSEHLVAGAQAREHYYDLTLHATRDGIALGIEGELWIDAGAYALWPTGAFAEAGMAARNLCGPYRIAHLDVTHHTVATTKPPMGPYRGVGRTGACFAVERLLDALADETGLSRSEIRRRNLLGAAELPHTTPSGLTLDSGDYRAALDAAEAMLDHADIAARRARGERIGVGVALYTEQSGHGTAEWAQRKNRVVPGHEAATLRMHPDGSLTLLTAIQSHGQGLETSLAQIVAHELGVHPDTVEVRHGDTALSPFGFGTFASRSLVFAGGAAERAARDLAAKLSRIAAHLLQADAASVTLRDGAAFVGAASVPLADIAHAALLRQERLPAGEPPGLEAHVTYSPPDEGGVFSYAAHVAVAQVDEETGAVALLDYCVAEDCGTMINPMIVDGQVHGGVAQGIGTALMEEIRFDADGQPLAATFLDYRLPEASALPPIRVRHLVTPARATVHGAKGVGEGGAIAPPAAIVSAVENALSDLRVRFDVTPLTAARVHAAIRSALR
jgi:carbon-monoxide dehydrogenase large subunit